jgi:antitoxin component YwqK of YwqJK toxin-antitoxin module
MHPHFHRVVMLCLLAFLASCGKPKEVPYLKLGYDGTTLTDPETKKPFTGISRQYHKDGQVSMEAPLKNGKFHGMVREWYPNGKKKAETEFANGERNGKCTEWTEAGLLFVECVYVRDKEVSRKEYQTGK